MRVRMSRSKQGQKSLNGVILLALVCGLLIFAVLFQTPARKTIRYVAKIDHVQSVDEKSFKVSDLPKTRTTVWLQQQFNDDISRRMNETIPDKGIKIVFVVCGEDEDLIQQTVTALKSLTFFALSILHVIIISDSSNQENAVLAAISNWPESARSVLRLSFRTVWYPDGYRWMKNYRTKCTTERLYLPKILFDEDSVIYLDTDIVFLDFVDKLWDYFYQMDDKQVVAMAAEHEDSDNAFYNSQYNKIPYYGKLGLNAGVLLMNLTRIRNLPEEWTELVHDVYNKYKYAPLHFADQDILNVIFSFRPEKCLLLPCNWNYRSDHCSWKGNTCVASSQGVSLLHGNRKVFHNDKDLTFRSVYKAFQNYNWEANFRTALLQPLISGLTSEFNTFCANNHSIYVVHLARLLSE